MSQMQPGPYQTPMSSPIVNEIKSKATNSLIMGIIGLFCIGIILGPIAIYMGNGAKRLIAQHNCGHEHDGTATAGLVIGWIVTILNVLSILFFIAYFIFIAVLIGASSQM